MEIFADIILMINFVMNSFILWTIAKIMRHKVHYPRLLAGGLVMALMYLIAMIVLPFSMITSALASLAMLSAGILIGLKPKSSASRSAKIRTFLIQLFTGYLCSFTLGGMGMMLVHRVSTAMASGTANSAASGASGVSLSLLIVCILIAYVLIKLGLRLIEGVTIKKQMLCPVTIYIGENNMSLQALVDTGHTLHDPLNNAPVIIAEFESVKELLPDRVRLMFYEKQENDLSGILTATAGSRFYERIRMIPFASLGLSNGMLIGFRPDRVYLSTAQRDHHREDVVVGIYNKKLSGDGRYQGLIGPELVG